MDVLVTGGAGFIGNALVHRLLESGHNVRVLDNQSRFRIDGLKSIRKSIEFVGGDVRDFDVVRRAVADCEVVWHLAAINGTRFFYERPDIVLEVGIQGTLNVVNACIEAEVRRMIYVSSSEVYASPTEIPTPEQTPLHIPDPTNPRCSYGGGKIAGELMMRHIAGPRGLDGLIVRPHNFYGPNMGFEHIIPETVHQLMRLSKNLDLKHIVLPIQGSGKETRAFCHIKDGIRGLELAASAGAKGSVFNIGNDQEIEIAHVIEKIAHILGLEVEILAGEVRPGSPLRRCPDISHLRGLGYAPNVGIDEGLEETVLWYREHFTLDTSV
jgi:nucleoside-diphosphate-sugar epimerase